MLEVCQILPCVRWRGYLCIHYYLTLKFYGGMFHDVMFVFHDLTFTFHDVMFAFHGVMFIFQVDVFHVDEPLSDSYALLDIAHIYNWTKVQHSSLFK